MGGNITITTSMYSVLPRLALSHVAEQQRCLTACGTRNILTSLESMHRAPVQNHLNVPGGGSGESGHMPCPWKRHHLIVGVNEQILCQSHNPISPYHKVIIAAGESYATGSRMH